VAGIIQRGEGPPIVLVPGIQGRYEWMLPTVHALSTFGRVITFSLCDEPSSGFSWSPQLEFENYLAQIDDVVRQAGAERPVLVGISYGGLIAAEYAARHPEVAGLVVASSPPPTWQPDRRAQRYLASPRLLAPAFWLGAPVRAYPELKAALPGGWERWHFAVEQGLRIAAAPPSTARMARRLHWIQSARFTLDHSIDVPALIVTGEPDLERVVPPQDTARYLDWMPAARTVTLARTGHAGSVTRAREFARHVAEFLGGLDLGFPEVRSAESVTRSVRADGVS
jgi:pimeloyl-ACP methyl ester carboxylesterase